MNGGVRAKTPQDIGSWLAAWVIAMIWLGAAASEAAGESVKGIVSRTLEPLVIRGGVILLPLAAEQAGDGWPPRLELGLADGVKVAGQVVWIEPAPPPAQRHWTDDPRQLTIRAVRPEDDSAKADPSAGQGPYLLARCPIGAGTGGEIRFGRQVLKPSWQDPPDAPGDAVADERTTLDLVPSPDRPDPVSPFEYWRWVLLADRLEMKPPAPFGGEIEQMAAEHFAGVWRVGMGRLKRLSPRIAEECRDLLTRTCIDRRQPFAAWIADPLQVGALMTLLSDAHQPDSSLLSAAVAWVDEQPQLVVWPESEMTGQVRLAAFTAGTEAVTAKVRWRDAPEDSFLAAPFAPGVMSHVNIDRPPPQKPEGLSMPKPPRPESNVLIVEVGEQRYELAFGPETVVARPPGAFFRQLSPPITLAEAQLRARQAENADRATFASLRKLGGRWEIFIDCRRPGGPAEEGERQLPAVITSLDDARGVEAATILLGEDDPQRGPAIWLAVPENGFQNLARGANDGTLQVHKKSYADRWYCRIVLPESWVPDQEGVPLLLGVLRSHRDCDQMESGPAVSTPWNPRAGRAAIRVDQWDDLPRPE